MFCVVELLLGQGSFGGARVFLNLELNTSRLAGQVLGRLESSLAGGLAGCALRNRKLDPGFPGNYYRLAGSVRQIKHSLTEVRHQDDQCFILALHDIVNNMRGQRKHKTINRWRSVLF